MDIVNRAEIPEGTRLVEREVFRDVIGHFASGVTVITTRDEDVNYGLTASAVSSLSLDPPMVLVCINKRTGTPTVISKVKVFAVNILREDQQAIARQFATPHPDKFRDIPIVFGELGVPLLSTTLASEESPSHWRDASHGRGVSHLSTIRGEKECHTYLKVQLPLDLSCTTSI
jgi:flavin reductase (DIM6/NTAB) family NADH-FMN oxidoreductase RutF